MTEHDLATMLRTHVSDEPPFDDGAAADVIVRGRRSVRRRRLNVAAGGVAACALAVALGVPHLMSAGTDPERGIDPAIAEAINAYNVTAMPHTMDEHARSILQASVPDLGEADFVAFDAQYQRLLEKYWDKASGLFLRYDLDSSHQINVMLNRARSSAEGDFDDYCEGVLAAGWYIECSVHTSKDGDISITTLGAESLQRPRGRTLKSWKDQFSVVLAGELGSVPTGRLWFSQSVKVIKSDTFVTYVSEEVQAPDLDTARERLRVPVDDLGAIGLDPALVMPKPPPGENGCSQWTMPTMQVSCMDNE